MKGPEPHRPPGRGTAPLQQLSLFPNAPDTPPAALPKDCSWHTLTLAGLPLGYALRRSRRKSIGLVVRDTGLLIQAPTWASQQQINETIAQKSHWIQEKLRKRAERLELLALQASQWREGGRIPYLGVPIRLHLDGGQALRYQGDPDAPTPGDRLSLPLPHDAAAERIQERAQGWLQQRARLEFESRLNHYLALAGQAINGWSLSSAQGRWGSCTSQRHIRLNWRLIHFDPPLIDYVVAHEVAHLRHMDHSPEFWREVDRLYPDFKQARDTLARHTPQTQPLF
ncbi:YgjP-like metallopeptidase domain-containing protein OS=Castellaniella defragrans OX=75697 GN=HNR28_001782 PE=4 SV=1 [Castellaniella defragrans]